MPDDQFFESGEARRQAEALVVDVDGYAGPLDVLLTLARSQKVDLRRVSILALAEQYLQFVDAAKRSRIELAADYLVMAAWLAFLKSRLLLPPDPEEEGPSGEELAAHLAFQLERLEGMREAAARLMSLDRLGRDRFARGAPDELSLSTKITYRASVLDLMQAYARIKTRDDFQPLHYSRSPVLTIEEALERLRRLVGDVAEWCDLTQFLPEAWCATPQRRRSAMASTFVAALELTRTGQTELRQREPFAPLELRRRG